MARPFTFDLQFDEDPADKAARLKAAADRKAAEEAAAMAAEPPPPTFSEAELETAQAAAFEAGRSQGHAEALETIEQRSLAALEEIGRLLPQIFAQHEAAMASLADDAVELAYVMVRKLAPELSRRGAPSEIDAVVRDCFANLRGRPRVVVKVAQSLAAPLAPRIAETARMVGFEGQVQVLGDAALAPGDCVLDWVEGGAERLTAEIWREVDEAVVRMLGHLPIEHEEQAHVRAQ